MGGTKPDLAEGSGLTRQPLSGQSTDQNTRCPELQTWGVGAFFL